MISLARSKWDYCDSLPFAWHISKLGRQKQAQMDSCFPGAQGKWSLKEVGSQLANTKFLWIERQAGMWSTLSAQWLSLFSFSGAEPLASGGGQPCVPADRSSRSGPSWLLWQALQLLVCKAKYLHGATGRRISKKGKSFKIPQC